MVLEVGEHSVRVPPVGVPADLVVPEHAAVVIVFAHGSGSSRHSPRNRYVAGVLQQGGFGTLLLDLLTEAEEQVDLRTRLLRFDVALLAGRLIEATEWIRREQGSDLRVGYFGASTGAAAALVAAAARPPAVAAGVSRGGRPDLAGPALAHVRAPTLLIVGGSDTEALKLNQDAVARLPCEKRLAVVPGATHLFEERGALAQVADLAWHWFHSHFH